MCQMTIFLRKNKIAPEEKIAENAALLEMAENTATISSLFEESQTLERVRVQRIDFLKGKVVLEELGS